MEEVLVVNRQNADIADTLQLSYIAVHGNQLWNSLGLH